VNAARRIARLSETAAGERLISTRFAIIAWVPNMVAADMQGNPAREALNLTVKQILGSFLGTGLSRRQSQVSPMTAGILGSAFYSLIPLLQMLLVAGSRELIVLSCWGAVYFGIVVALTRSTSLAVSEIVDLLVLPNISEGLAESVRTELSQRFVRTKIIVKSVVAAGAAVLISCWSLHRQYSWPSLSLWSIGFFILYFTAAQATITAQFYTCFGHSLRQYDTELFPMDPTASPAISALTRLARRILYYWFLVFLLVMSLLGIPKIIPGFVGASSTSDIDVLIYAVVLVAGFFSFVFGSLVYFKFENDLRIDVERVRLATLLDLQAQYCRLFIKQASLSEEEQAYLEQIKVTADYLASSGNFKTSLQSVGTTLMAVFPPAVAIVVAVLKYYQKP
jgi:hypothetical protein